MTPITFKILRSVCACIVLLAVTNCDFIFNDEINNESEEELNKKIVEINKDEAKLLVQATQNNLDIIELIQVVKKSQVDSTTHNILSQIENNQLEVFKTYTKAANKHVISIPNQGKIKSKSISIDDESDIGSVFDTIKNKINKQITVLEALETASNKKDFKALANTANKILSMSLDNTLSLEDDLNSENEMAHNELGQIRIR